MTTMLAARETIYQTFVTAWSTTTQYTFGNEKFSPPAEAAWVRLNVQHLVGSQETLGGTGNRRFSRSGLVTIQLFVPQDTGMETADGYIATLRAMYEGKTISGPIWFTDANVQEIGPTDGWHQTNIDIEFSYEETK